MRRWGLVIAALYALALIAVTWPVLILCFIEKDKPVTEFLNAYAEPGYWAILLILVLCQLALVSIPVGPLERPTSKRSILPMVIAGSLAVGGLIFGGAASLCELLLRDAALNQLPFVAIVGAVSWVIWGVIFHRASKQHAPEELARRQAMTLFRGSVLELLIAVPTHIFIRGRDYCCAGVMTFFGIALGVAVMLMSFGPAVFLLYLARWRRLRG